MKTTLLLLTILFISGYAAVYAQTTTYETKLNSETREMANKLGLNEFGYIRLKKLNLRKAAETEKITANYTYDLNLQQEKLTELETTYDLQLRAFLRLRQLEAYLALKDKTSTLIAQEPGK